ncbi:MAG TPA: hypothetical protein VMH81_11780 [Bryobacteraceae bacterium]|nr:hypothetical protein [Bryobacteraceae bacterium]
MRLAFAAAGLIVLHSPALPQTAAPAISISPSLLNSLQWRSIGPAATGGRIADLAVARIPGAPSEIYVATTTGGVFKSVNEGVSFTPVFDNAGGMMSIGAVAVAPSNPSVVWVGTGEADNRQSSSWGDGVYKSTDGGRTWQKMGLEETRHVGKIVIHPSDPNTVYVAAVGHLWGSNPERGVFKTTDGGKSWTKVLYRDEHTGAIDLAMDPKDPSVLFAAMYQRQRKGWGFNGGGPGSGIFRTTDGGAHWTELKNGLPAGDKGRIGLTIFPADNRILYAIVEADPPFAGGGRGGTSGNQGEAAGGPRAGGGRGGRGAGAPQTPQRGGIFRSQDQGETWEHMTGLNPRPSYYSRIYVDPKNANRVYIMGSNRGFYISDDAARSFRDVFSGVHGEDHALWIDPDNTNRLIIGGDGGVSISYDRGLTWLFRINLPIGQFYDISANNEDPFLVCGGLQDNGSWCTPSASRLSHGISFKDAFNIGGGDGMQAVFDGDDHTVLVSLQNGVTNRLDLDNMQRQSIGPVQPPERPGPGQTAYRWYWTTPLIVSSFNPATIYTGANLLFRSDDRGVNWKPISPDLTANIDRNNLPMMGAPVPTNALSRHDGQSNFSALTVIAESPLDRNVLYTGADDGTIRMTRDGGAHWTDLTPNVHGLPHMLNISGIAPSRFSAGRVYLTVDGHFNDDYHAYVFVSEDYGKSWNAITNGLPATSVHRIREHPANPNFLVVGMEMGVYATFDRGAHWTTIGANFPPVPVYDLLFQGSEHALVLGTHGRSIWVLDHVEPLAQLTSEVVNGNGHLFPVPPTHFKTIQVGQFWFGAGEFFAPNPPYGALLTYYLPKGAAGVGITISDSAGKVIRTMSGPGEAGLNRTCWDLRRSPPLDAGQAAPANCAGGGVPEGGGGFGRANLGPVVLPGKYTVTVTPAGGPVLRTEATVGPDPHFPISDADRKSRYAAITSAYTLPQQLAPARDAAEMVAHQAAAMRQYLAAGGENARGALEVVDRVAREVSRVQGQIARTLTAAANVLGAIDGYEGLPTGSQLQQLNWAWEDAISAVTALNQLIRDDLQPAYSTMAGPVKLPEVKPVPLPVRP